MGHHHHNHHGKYPHHNYDKHTVGPPLPPTYYSPTRPHAGFSAIQPYNQSDLQSSNHYIAPNMLPPLPTPIVNPQVQHKLDDAIADYHRHSRNERLAEVVALGAGAFAIYEAHEAKVDPSHARRHKLEAEIAGATALGSAAYAWHEHKEKKKDEHRIQKLNGQTEKHKKKASSDPGHSHHGHHKHRFW